MAINVDKIMEYIDRIGVDEANRRIDSYPQVGPTVEEYFGEQKCEEFEKAITKSGSE